MLFLSFLQRRTTLVTSALLPWIKKLDWTKFFPLRDAPHLEGRQNAEFLALKWNSSASPRITAANRIGRAVSRFAAVSCYFVMCT